MKQKLIIDFLGPEVIELIRFQLQKMKMNKLVKNNFEYS